MTEMNKEDDYSLPGSTETTKAFDVAETQEVTEESTSQPHMPFNEPLLLEKVSSFGEVLQL